MVKSNIVDFIKKAKGVHGDTYDYSKSTYVNNKTPLLIICKKHGEFLQAPNSHLSGRGCPFCGIDKKKGLIRGVAFNDTYESKQSPAYKCWLDLIRRCFPKTEHERRVSRSYKGCKVCEEWLRFSNFLVWYNENAKSGYCLDKDLFSDSNEKCYSPKTCCFIPKELNNALQVEHLRMQKKETKRFFNKSKGVFEAKLSIKGKTFVIGVFKTEQEAICAYIQKKEEYIRQLAKEYRSRGLITDNIFYKLLNFKVSYANY